MAGKKRPFAEKEELISITLGCIAKCMTATNICRHLAEAHGVPERTTWAIYKEAKQRLVKLYDQKRSECVAEEIAKLDAITEKALQCNQLSAAVGAVGAKLRVIGADAPRG